MNNKKKNNEKITGNKKDVKEKDDEKITGKDKDVKEKDDEKITEKDKDIKEKDDEKKQNYIPAHVSIVIVTMVILICSVGGLIRLNQIKDDDIKNLKNQVEQKEAIIRQNEDDIKDKEDKVEAIKSKLLKTEQEAMYYKSKNLFFDEKLVIASETDGKYHKYDCEKLSLESYYIITPEIAKEMGFEPCSECIEESVEEYPEESESYVDEHPEEESIQLQ
ncbi:MAG: hypothetical protein IKN54_02775 [Lachnospiraceae bacterium]|nr:hypothetical protein [Lachnospiraceae bacterium]